MAAQVTFDGGYDVEVIADYPQELNCGICSLIIKDAIHGCINHAFCDSCIRRYVTYDIRSDGNVICPGGCREIINPTKLQTNHYVDRMIKTIKTKCANESCSWQGDLLDLVQIHQIYCDYKIVSCVNKGCLEMGFTKDLMQHAEVCLYKLIPCDYCQSNIAQINKGRHEAVCSQEVIKCEYNDIGCKTVFCRKDVQLHEINHQSQHTRLIYKNFNSQLSSCNKKLSNCKDELLKSNREVSNLKQQNTDLKKQQLRQQHQLEQQKGQVQKLQQQQQRIKELIRQ